MIGIAGIEEICGVLDNHAPEYAAELRRALQAWRDGSTMDAALGLTGRHRYQLRKRKQNDAIRAAWAAIPGEDDKARILKLQRMIVTGRAPPEVREHLERAERVGLKIPSSDRQLTDICTKSFCFEISAAGVET